MMINDERPHVVKFSGGRSSGMMLMQMLEEKQLNPKRCDVETFYFSHTT